MNKTIKTVVDYLYDKKLNGSLSRKSGEILYLISLSKMIDSALVIGSERGLAPLFIKSAIPEVHLDIIGSEEGKKNTETVLRKAGVTKFSYFDKEPKMAIKDLLQYDLIVFDGDESNYQEWLDALVKGKKWIMEAFVVMNNAKKIETQSLIVLKIEELTIIKL